MPILNVEGVTHWSIPVNDLEEAEEYYGELLGLAPVGTIREQHHVLLQRWRPQHPAVRASQSGGRAVEGGRGGASFLHRFSRDLRACVQGLPREKRHHRSFDVSSPGVFTGRELYFFDPSGNRLELRDPTWTEGMPEPSFAELAGA